MPGIAIIDTQCLVLQSRTTSTPLLHPHLPVTVLVHPVMFEIPHAERNFNGNGYI